MSVAIGEKFESSDEDSYTINPHQRSDYDALLAALTERGPLPVNVVHMWGVTRENHPADLDAYDQSLAHGFYSLLFLAQALGERGITTPIQIGVVTSQAYVVAGDELACSLKATVSGACKVIPQEYPNISCLSIDVDRKSVV